MNETLELKLRNLTYVVIGGFVVTFLLLIGLYFRSNTWTRESSTGNENTDNSTPNVVGYDSSRFTKVDGSEAAALFKDKKNHVLLIGRPGCSFCQDLVPKINQVVDEMKIEIHYLELPDEGWNPNDWNDLYPYLDIETTINSSDGPQTGTYGKLIKANGFTPVVIMIKNGKMTDDTFVGTSTVDDLKTLFAKYF